MRREERGGGGQYRTYTVDVPRGLLSGLIIEVVQSYKKSFPFNCKHSSDMDSTGEDSQNDFKERLNALLKGPELPDPAGKTKMKKTCKRQL